MDNVYILGGLRSFVGVVNGMYRHIPAEKLGAAVLYQLLVEGLRAAELTDYEIYKQFVFMTGLPKNEGGKIDKKVLQNYTF